MNTALLLHVGGGAVALAAGYVALIARKGGGVHRRSGMMFAVAMLVMGASATVLALTHGKPVTALGGPLVAYLVVTAVMSVRPLCDDQRALHYAMLMLAIVVGGCFLVAGVTTLASTTGNSEGVPALPIFLNGMIAVLGGIGDARVLRQGPLKPAARVRRHLWRMCYAFFIASGSFFLGQADVIPSPLRLMPALIILASFPLLALPYWLWRTREARRPERDTLINFPLKPRTKLEAGPRRPRHRRGEYRIRQLGDG